MSLINQALKLEQQRRNTASAPPPPMIARASRSRGEKWPLILFGVTGMGALLAVSITAIFYFGTGFLDQRSESAPSQSLASGQSSSTPATTVSPEPTERSSAEAGMAEMLSELSPEDMSAVQQMLLQQKAKQTGVSQTKPLASSGSPHPAPVSPRNSNSLSELSRIQSIVDGFSLQGIRKSGQDSRVFLNGKIYGIGDVVDIENGLLLIGFTDTDLVFRDRSGQEFKKAI